MSWWHETTWQPSPGGNQVRRKDVRHIAKVPDMSSSRIHKWWFAKDCILVLESFPEFGGKNLVAQATPPENQVQLAWVRAQV